MTPIEITVEGNVASGAQDLGITYPVALDNGYSTWTNYRNRYWPAKYFVDRNGRIRYAHFGEGGYEESERVLRRLLAEDPDAELVSEGLPDETPSGEQTPETYLGYQRLDRFVDLSEDRVRDPLEVDGDLGGSGVEGLAAPQRERDAVPARAVEADGQGRVGLRVSRRVDAWFVDVRRHVPLPDVAFQVARPKRVVTHPCRGRGGHGAEGLAKMLADAQQRVQHKEAGECNDKADAKQQRHLQRRPVGARGRRGQRPWPALSLLPVV